MLTKVPTHSQPLYSLAFSLMAITFGFGFYSAVSGAIQPLGQFEQVAFIFAMLSLLIGVVAFPLARRTESGDLMALLITYETFCCVICFFVCSLGV